MLHPKIREQLLEHLGSSSTLTRRKKEIQKKYGPMTSDEAGYVVAHLLGIDISQHLPLSILDRIRSLIPRGIPSDKMELELTRKTPVVKPSKSSYPLVNKAEIEMAHHLGRNIYPLLFLLENSIRALIKKRLSKEGEDWWDKMVPANVKRNVKRTITNEERYTYREKRGDHPLFYANFNDLKKIILDKYDDYFSDVIYRKEWFEINMDDVYMARNNLAHCVSLTEVDINDISKFHGAWARMLETAKVK